MILSSMNEVYLMIFVEMLSGDQKKDFQQIGGKSRFDLSPLCLKTLSGMVKSNKFFS
jgi:hypothetical protein